MPNPYPVALRERAVRAYETRTDTYADVAARFSIHVNTLVRWVAGGTGDGHGAAGAERRRLVLPGQHTPAPRTGAGAPRPYDRRADARVQSARRTRGTRPSVERVASLAAHRIRVQKKRSRPAELDRASVQAERRAFQRWVRRIDPRRLVFPRRIGRESGHGALARVAAARGRSGGTAADELGHQPDTGRRDSHRPLADAGHGVGCVEQSAIRRVGPPPPGAAPAPRRRRGDGQFARA